MDRFIKVERVLGDKAMLQVDWNRWYEKSHMCNGSGNELCADHINLGG